MKVRRVSLAEAARRAEGALKTAERRRRRAAAAEARATGDTELAVYRKVRTCRYHGRQEPQAWGCPECTRELRQQVARLRAALVQYGQHLSTCRLETSGPFQYPCTCGWAQTRRTWERKDG